MSGVEDVIQNQIALAVQRVAYQASAALTNADEETGKPTTNHGSGVLIEIAGRVFVATVAHVRKTHMSHLDVMVPDRKGPAWPRIKKRHCMRAGNVDVV